MPVRLAPLALCLLVCAACCNEATRGGTGSRPEGERDGDQAESGEAARCDALRERVEEIYRSEQGPPPEEKEKQELRADILEANVHMILADCRKDPDRFAPCIEEAESVEKLESDCIIPLDDEGKVEGRRFGPD